MAHTCYYFEERWTEQRRNIQTTKGEHKIFNLLKQGGQKKNREQGHQKKENIITNITAETWKDNQKTANLTTNFGLLFTLMLIFPTYTWPDPAFSKNPSTRLSLLSLETWTLLLINFTCIFPVNNLPYVLQIIRFHIFVLHQDNTFNCKLQRRIKSSKIAADHRVRI
jgi:hypothetical protein